MRRTEFRALGGSRVYKGTIRSRQNGNPSLHDDEEMDEGNMGSSRYEAGLVLACSRPEPGVNAVSDGRCLDSRPTSSRSATAAVSTTGTPVRLSETMAENVLATQDMAQVAFWSGSGGNPDMYVTSVDGGEPKRLTDDPAPDVFPSWSPDGTLLVFTSRRSGSNGIYVMNGEGTDQRGLITGRVELTNNLSPDGYTSWSPDGESSPFLVETLHGP